MRILKLILILTCCLLLVGWSAVDKHPKKGELEAAFQNQYLEEGHLSLDSFDVEVLQNLGNKVEPVWGSRFKAVVKSKEPLYSRDKKMAGKNVFFVKLRNKKGSPNDIYGKIFSTIYQGKWKNKFEIDGDPFSEFGKPLDQINAGNTIVSGSQEEKIYYKEQSENMWSADPVEEPNNNVIPLKKGQVWSGYYTCGQGETALNLNIQKVSGDEITAIFDFSFNKGNKKGEFYMHGQYNKSTQQLLLIPGEWINNPNKFYSVGMVGHVSQKKIRYKGRILAPTCGNFNLYLEQ